MTKEVKAAKKAADKKSEAATAETENKFDLGAATTYYRENSTIQKNGVRVITKDAFVKGVEERHGFTEAQQRKFHEAMMDERSAMANLAADDCVDAIDQAKKAGDSEEKLRNITRTVRAPTFGGDTDITAMAFDQDKIATKAGDAIKDRKNYGVIMTSVNALDGFHRNVAEDARKRIAKAMGQSED